MHFLAINYQIAKNTLWLLKKIETNNSPTMLNNKDIGIMTPGPRADKKKATAQMHDRL
jgi:hypothetical protein